MTALHQKLEEWIISQTHLLADRRLKLFPETPVFCRLTEGKNRKIWKYVVDHVRSYYTADKVRRILRVKHRQVEPENSYPVTDADHIRKRIVKCEEKGTFLNESISQLKRENFATEDEVRSIVDKVSILNQKSAILELIISEYNKKCAFLNSIHSQLNSYALKNSNQNTECYLVLNFPLVQYKSNFGVDQIANKVNCLLKQIHSLLMNSECKIFKSLTLVQQVNQMLDTISLANLFIYLKEISKASYIELMSNETYSASAQSLTIQKQNSEKHLQGMKLKFIQSCFDTKKATEETHRLQVKNESLFKSIMLKHGSDDAYVKKCKIFKKMAENVGLFQSIEFLENTLRDEQNEAKMLKEAKSSDLEAVVKNFHSNFDTLCMLLKSGSHMHKSIIELLLKLYTFANKQMFSNITLNLKEYPFQMQHNLIFDIRTLLSVLEKNDTINPLMPCSKYSTPENLMTILNVSRFENECVIGSKVKKIKDKLSNQDSEIKFEDSSFSNVHEQYIALIGTLQRMEDKLELCNRNFGVTSEHNHRVNIVLRNWWEQGAQFIPQLEWEDKSLKMWLDILLVLPNF